jgi:hypothetical protein
VGRETGSVRHCDVEFPSDDLRPCPHGGPVSVRDLLGRETTAPDNGQQALQMMMLWGIWTPGDRIPWAPRQVEPDLPPPPRRVTAIRQPWQPLPMDRAA